MIMELLIVHKSLDCRLILQNIINQRHNHLIEDDYMHEDDRDVLMMIV